MILAHNAVVYLFRRAWKYSDKKPNVVLYIFLQIVSSVITLFEPWPLAKALTRGLHILSQPRDSQSVGNDLLIFCGWLGVFTALVIVSRIPHYYSRRIERANAYRIRANYKTALVDGVVDQPQEWHENHPLGETVDKVNQGVAGLFGFATESFQLIKIGVSLVGSCALVIYYDYVCGLIAAGMIILISIIIAKFDKILLTQYQHLNHMENRISKEVLSILANLNTVIAARGHQWAKESLGKSIAEPYELQVKSNNLAETKWLLMIIASNLMVVMVLLTYVLKHFWLGAGFLVVFLVLFEHGRRMVSSFNDIASIYGVKVQQKAMVMNSEELVESFQDKNA